MEALELARWQFGITTVYHFILVPLTLGLSILVAVMQSMWMKTKKDKWLRLTKFFGKLLVINFSLGVATGIVQEFQFGMNWSEYSRFVGDVFGAPLAMEALVAFFLESTFLGLWIFGWDRLSRPLHLAVVWLFAIGSNLSAYFIIAANSWMQHPVGAEYNPVTGRAEMTDVFAVLTNSTTLWAFPHVIATAFLVAGTVVAGISGAWMVRAARRQRVKATKAHSEDLSTYRTATRFGAWVMLAAGAAVIVTGDFQAKLMFEQQPMKMAAAEALCETTDSADFSLLTIGDWNAECEDLNDLLVIPGLTSFLATGDWSGEVTGIPELQSTASERFGEGDYTPNLPVVYWSFRFMIGLGAFSAALALAALWLTRGGRTTDKRWFRWLALVALPAPYLAASFGWIFTEMGRQPWVVAPNPTGDDQIFLQTLFGVSEAVDTTEVAISFVAFTVIYAVLGVFWYRLMHRYAVEGLPEAIPPEPKTDDKPLSFAY